MPLHHAGMSHEGAPLHVAAPMFRTVPRQLLLRPTVEVTLFTPQRPVDLEQLRNHIPLKFAGAPLIIVMSTSLRRWPTESLLVVVVPSSTMASPPSSLVLVQEPRRNRRSTRSVHRRWLLVPRQEHPRGR